jgi:hypothetical protein
VIRVANWDSFKAQFAFFAKDNVMRSHRQIKFQLIISLAMALSFCTRSARAQTFTIDFDEYGNGTIQQPGAPPSALVSLGNIIDPFDPSNGLMPLGYSLSGSLPGFIPIDGDVIMQEPNIGTVSDVLRWYQGLLMVYSDRPEVGEINPPPADVGLPGMFQNNSIVANETGPEAGPNGLFGYNPGFTGPGALSAPVIYNFTSDYAVPEPASVGLIGLAVGLILLRRWR